MLTRGPEFTLQRAAKRGADEEGAGLSEETKRQIGRGKLKLGLRTGSRSQQVEEWTRKPFRPRHARPVRCSAVRSSRFSVPRSVGRMRKARVYREKRSARSEEAS